jgi:hypothetical protein
VIKKQPIIPKLGQLLVKFLPGLAWGPGAAVDRLDNAQDRDAGPDDRALEREDMQIVSLPYFG